jgi:hypothetical protein
VAILTPKPRFAINGFVVAYHPHKRIALHYYPRTRSDWFAVCACDGNWQVTSARGCRSLDSAMDIAEEVFGVPRRAWSVVSDEVEPWRQPAAKTFEHKRLDVLAELRRRQQADAE